MGLIVLLVEELRVLASDTAIRISGAAALVALALWQIARSHRHPRWVGMRLKPRELTLWSFLMSTAHGAGLMLIPVVVGIGVHSRGDMIMPSSLGPLAAAVLIHTAAMIAVAGAIAVVVYQFLGVGVLRRGWLNLDRLWPYALGAGAAATLVLA
jgi:ABC-type Co2+ transport system permease subunit